MRLLTLQFQDLLGQQHSMKFQLLDVDGEQNPAMLSFLNAGKFYEPDISLFMLRVLRPGDKVVDIGANIGFFTLFSALLVGPKGRVVSCEPAEANLERLHHHLAINELNHVTVLPKVITHHAGEVSFFLNSDCYGGHALWNPAEYPGNEQCKQMERKVVMNATTLDALTRDTNLGTPTLIKIDTEGAEQMVVMGGNELLASRRVPFVVCELHEFGLQKMGHSQQTLRSIMRDHGYGTFLLQEDGSFPKLVPDTTRIVSRFIRNVVFADLDRLAPFWPEERVL